jgi:hypothetical protein
VLATKTASLRGGTLGEYRTSARGEQREADMERTDWLDEGFDSAQARFLMATAITHHRFSSPLWGGDEVAKLHAELAEIDQAAAQAYAAGALTLIGAPSRQAAEEVTR